jgi:hypothetical protein
MVDDALLVTSIGYSGRAAIQLMHSLGRALHVYTFGLRDGVVIVTGTAFANVCGGSRRAGMNAMMDMVSSFESKAESGSTTSIQLGRLSFKGMVDSLRSTWADAGTGAMGFELRFHASMGGHGGGAGGYRATGST